MQITKRTGEREAYDRSKIRRAVAAAFASVDAPIGTEELEDLCLAVEGKILAAAAQDQPVQVEAIQDMVEQTLMERQYYAQMKSYILYRENRSKKRAARARLTACFFSCPLEPVLKDIQKDFSDEAYSLDRLFEKFSSLRKEGMQDAEQLQMLIKSAVELTTQEAPQWEYIAARLLMLRFRLRLETELEKNNIHTFYEKLQYMADQKLYGSYMLDTEGYTKAEIDSLEQKLRPERDKLLTYSALELLLKRYVI